MIISFLNQKGGVGKTTIAIHVAVTLTQYKHRVLLVDADPQGSVLDWSETRREISDYIPLDSPSVIGLPKKTLHKELPNFTKNFDYIIIDGPPRAYEITRSAIVASDLVVIPIQPSPYDVWAAREIIELVNEAALFKYNLKAVFAVNRKIVNTAIGRDVFSTLEEFNLPILKSSISQRIAFAETAAQGKTVMDVNRGRNTIACKEILDLTSEIMEVLSNGQENIV